MTNNIDKQSFGEAGCKIVTGDELGAGQYCALQFVTEGELTSFTPVSTSLTEGTYDTSVTYPAGFVLFTPFTNVEPAAGVTVVAYKAL
jgi:hypothetical protein